MVVSAPSMPARKTWPFRLRATRLNGKTVTVDPRSHRRRRWQNRKITESKNRRHGRLPFPSPRSRAHTLTV
jgi:hypothetical protein